MTFRAGYSLLWVNEQRRRSRCFFELSLHLAVQNDRGEIVYSRGLSGRTSAVRRGQREYSRVQTCIHCVRSSSRQGIRPSVVHKYTPIHSVSVYVGLEIQRLELATLNSTFFVLYNTTSNPQANTILFIFWTLYPLQILASLERIIRPCVFPERTDGLLDCKSDESQEETCSLEVFLHQVSLDIYYSFRKLSVLLCSCIHCLAGLCLVRLCICRGVSIWKMSGECLCLC